MNVIKSNLTSKQLLDNSLRGAILFHLREGETEEGMIAQFKGDLLATVEFMRDRSYEGMEIVERKPKPVEPKPKPVEPKPKAVEKSTEKKEVKKKPAPTKPKPPTSEQSTLF